MKICLVSDTSLISTLDVYGGYCDALDELEIPYERISMPSLLASYSIDHAWALTLSKILIKENQFTHIFFIAGTMVPKWVWESLYDKTVCLIGTDDPHITRMILQFKEYIHYWFTNEKKITNPKIGIHYVTTACSKEQIEQDKQVGNPKYFNDVCFIGSVYPNRVKPLETMIKWCKKNNKKFVFLGGTQFVPEGSVIHSVRYGDYTENYDTLCYYANSKCVVNLNRDPRWSPVETGGNKHLVDIGEPYSMNPRGYEVAICKAPQLYVEPRKETIDVFGDNVFCCKNTRKEIESKLNEIFSISEQDMKDKTDAAYKIVCEGHTYTDRLKQIMNILIHQ